MSSFTRTVNFSNVKIVDLEGNLIKSYKTTKNVSKKSVMKEYLKNIGDDFKAVNIEIETKQEKRSISFDDFMNFSKIV